MGKFKIILIYALDRMARDVRFLLNLLYELDSYGVSVISIRESIDLSTPIGKAVTQILGAIAELERNLISERIKTSLAVKKQTAHETGWRCGRPPVSDNLKNKVMNLRAKGLSIRKISKELKGQIGHSSVAKIIKEMNYPTCPQNPKNPKPSKSNKGRDED